MRHPSRSQGGPQIAPNQNIIILDQQRHQQQHQQPPKMPSPLGHLQEARKAKSNSGKLFLAAIVHYDSFSPSPPELVPDCDKKTARLSDGRARVACKQQASDTNEQPAPCRRLGKFAKLFSLRSNKRPAQSHRSKLDHFDDIEKCKQEPEKRELSSARHTSDAIMMDGLGLRADRRQGDGVSSASTGTPECRLVGEQREESRVIEFKFDLIVEGDQGQEIDAEAAQSSPSQTEQILRPIKQRKLLDQVNDLVESFVLDSLDCCLINAGRRYLEASNIGHQFEYTLELAKLTLTYAFQLLQAAKEQATGALNYLSGRPSPLKIEAFSIELETTLFEAAGSDNLIVISDMLAADLVAPKSAAGTANTNQRLECHTAEEALEALHLVRCKLALKRSCESEKGDQNNNNNNNTNIKPNNLLMISLKLKQLINGGSFSNRLCLLDLAEPATSELGSIFGAIFNGQALGYLKREKVHLRSLEMQLDLMRRTEGRVESCASGPAASEQLGTTQEFNKKHHRIASSRRLIQAQWLIYKQLSAALIKTLVIVHCHRSTAPSNKATRQQNELEPLMEYNLDLLEFARALQKASSKRLRRRRRHLRSHMNSATNLSFVSDTNLSINFNDEHHSASRELANGLGGHDLMIGSTPLRLARPSCLGCLEDELDDQSSQYDLTDSALSTRSRFSHHQRRVNRIRSSGRHHYHHEHGYNRHHRHSRQNRYHPTEGAADSHWRLLCERQLSIDTKFQEARASSLSGGRRQRRRRQSELTGDSSSLVSTSSGSQRGRTHSIKTSNRLASSPPSQPGSHSQHIGYQLQLLQQQSQRMAPTRQPNQTLGAAPSDTEDSLASANLNSCSSLSMRDRQRSGDLHRLLKVMQSGGSREEELRWFNAAAGKLKLARKHSNTLDTASESTSIDSPSIELLSFCSNPPGQTPSSRTLQTVSALAPSSEETQNHHQSSNQIEDRLLDNASDICSVVAEPPRQLKLEQFLNQLSSAIAPNKTAPLKLANEALEGGDFFLANQNTNLNTKPQSASLDHEEDEDEDCKSHSSILEHLSSLTLETNLRLRLQSTPSSDNLNHEPIEAYRLQANGGLASNGKSSGRVNIIDECASSKPVGGHLQRLLKSNLQIQNSNGSGSQYQQQNLTALSIDCCASSARPIHQISAQVASDSTQNPFTPSSSDSCGSGSSSSSSAHRNAQSSGPESLPHASSLTINQLYSAVIRQHT